MLGPAGPVHCWEAVPARGGLRADVLDDDGIVAIGDLVETIDEGNSIEDGCPVMRGGKVVNLSPDPPMIWVGVSVA